MVVVVVLLLLFVPEHPKTKEKKLQKSLFSSVLFPFPSFPFLCFCFRPFSSFCFFIFAFQFKAEEARERKNSGTKEE